MKHLNKRLLSLLLTLVFLFSLVACDKGAVNPSEGTQAETEAPTVTFVPSQRYNIFRGELYRTCEEIVDAVGTLQSAFRAVYGVTCSSYSSLSGNGPFYEILVGDTGRPESNELLADLKVNDYAYKVVSENLIVICGGSALATVEAVNRFCSDVLGCSDANTAPQENRPITVGASYTYRDTYEYSQVKVNGIALSELTLAVAGGGDLSIAQPLIRAIGSYTGEHIRVVRYDQLTGNEKGVFCMGAGNRAGDDLVAVSYGAYKVLVNTAENDFTVCMDASNALFRKRAAEALLETVEVKTEGDTVSLQFKDCTLVNFGFSDLPDWTLKKETVMQLADGVSYISREYEDEDGLPYAVHAIEVDPAKAYFYMGSRNDGFASTGVQSVPNQIKAAMANGLQVIGGVNADFFDMEGDGHPRGLAIKEGRVIREAEDPDRGYFGYTYDGQIIISDTPSTHTQYDLRTAVGGRQVVLKDGMPANVGGTDSFSTTAHPRTLVGVKEDGKVILAVIDGRQPKVSNGAPLKRCAQLMAELGADTALNLDGGGSTTLTVVENGSPVTKNSLSGGAHRSVYNSLLVVLKPTE